MSFCTHLQKKGGWSVYRSKENQLKHRNVRPHFPSISLRHVTDGTKLLVRGQITSATQAILQSFQNQQREVCCIPVFSKIDFRHPCKHRKSAVLAIIVAESCLAYEQSCIFLRRARSCAKITSPAKKGDSRKEERKKGSLIGCFLVLRKLLMVGFFFLVCVFFHVSFNAFSVFFLICFLFLLLLRTVIGNILYLFSLSTGVRPSVREVPPSLIPKCSPQTLLSTSFLSVQLQIPVVMHIGGRGKLSAPQLCQSGNYFELPT